MHRLRLALVFLLSSQLLPVVGRARAEATTAPPAVLVAQAASERDGSGLLQLNAGGHALGFARGAMYVAAGSHALRTEFVGASTAPPVAEGAGDAKDGNTAPLTRVNYRELWKGVDLAYDATAEGILRSTWTVASGADPGQIQLQYNVPVSLGEDGGLRTRFVDGWMSESAPVAWQEVRGRRAAVPVSFRVSSGGDVGFSLGPYDRSQPLYIDPTITWHTFLGASDFDKGTSIAVDASGNIFVAGESKGTWGSPIRAFTPNQALSLGDVFVAKLASNGTLLWSTFLGGAGLDFTSTIGVDASGNAYVAGSSSETWGSPILPHTNANRTYTFVAKLNTDGAILWNTFLGVAAGVEGDTIGRGMAVDSAGNVYVTGEADGSWGSPVLPFVGAVPTFLAKVSTDGALVWNTFVGPVGIISPFGPMGQAFGYAIAVDADGNSYVTGESNDTWGAPIRAFQGTTRCVFVAKITADGNLGWNTFLASTQTTTARAIAATGGGDVFVTGYSNASWGTPINPYQRVTSYLARLAPNGTLAWNTFLGTATVGPDVSGITVDATGNVYLAGEAYLGKFDANGAPKWSVSFGGPDTDRGEDVAVGPSGGLYITGYSTSAWGNPILPFATPGTGTGNAFVAAIPANPNATTKVLFSSVGSQDGWALESAETSGRGGVANATQTTLRVGDDGVNKQYRSVLSFNTAALPDSAVITSAQLKLRYQGRVGTSPFTTHGNMLVDAKLGAFSNNTVLQIGDFQAAPTRSVAATVRNAPVASWYSTAIAPSYVNKKGYSQFRLRFAKDDDNDRRADYLSFYSGNAASAYRPVLEVVYYVP